MKAVILAAGLGSRIGNLTKKLPKPLIPIANKPILQHLMNTFHICGIKDLIVVVGHLKTQIINFCQNVHLNKLNIIIQEATNFQKGPLYSFYEGMKAIDTNEFILVPADLYIDPALLLNFLKQSQNTPLSFLYTDQSHQTSLSQIYLSETNQVLGINSKVIDQPSRIHYVLPLLLCRTALFDFIKRSMKLKYSKVIDIVQLYLQNGYSAYAFKVSNPIWFELDTINDILRANTFLIKQATSSHHTLKQLPSKCPENSMIIPPNIIGRNVHIENGSKIGPYVSIGDNSRIESGVVIQNAIICPHSNIPANQQFHNAIFFNSIYYSYNQEERSPLEKSI
ncbi:MAG: NTP transferase domain-containing protein [Candidatus Helarchaeota archaeon]